MKDTTKYVVSFSQHGIVSCARKRNADDWREYKTQAGAWKYMQQLLASEQYGFAVFAKVEDGKTVKAIGYRLWDGATRTLK